MDILRIIQSFLFKHKFSFFHREFYSFHRLCCFQFHLNKTTLQTSIDKIHLPKSCSVQLAKKRIDFISENNLIYC